MADMDPTSTDFFRETRKQAKSMFLIVDIERQR